MALLWFQVSVVRRHATIFARDRLVLFMPRQCRRLEVSGSLLERVQERVEHCAAVGHEVEVILLESPFGYQAHNCGG